METEIETETVAATEGKKKRKLNKYNQEGLVLLQHAKAFCCTLLAA